jgi:hypothetical protein
VDRVDPKKSAGGCKRSGTPPPPGIAAQIVWTMIPATARPPTIIENVVIAILDVVDYLNRPVAAKIVYVISIVVPLRMVKAGGYVLALPKVVDVSPHLVSLATEGSELSLMVFYPFIPILLAISHRLISFR